MGQDNIPEPDAPGLRLCRFGLRRLKMYFRRCCRRRGGTQKHEPTCAEWTNDGLHGDHEEVGHGLAAEVSSDKTAHRRRIVHRNAMALEEKELNMRRDRRGHPPHLTNPKRMRN